MKDEIINKVAQSKLVTFDLEDFYPEGKRMVLDIKEWLYEGIILREKEFRTFVEAHNWQQYKGTYVALQCSTDAIIPGWAFMLVVTKLNTLAKKTVQGTLEDLETAIYRSILDNMNVSEYKDRLVIIKGCSKKPVPPNAYLLAVELLTPVVKSIMYGEACSSVPLYKRNK